MRGQACLNDSSCFNDMVCKNNACECDIDNNYVWTNYSCGSLFELINTLNKELNAELRS